MPPSVDTSAEDVRSELTDILVQVVGCPPDDVVDRAKLKDLGVDSLAVVEMADELGRRFGLYLSDETVNVLRTVGDAVNAVVSHDGGQAPRTTTYSTVSLDPPEPEDAAPLATTAVAADPVDPEERNNALKRLAFWFATIGAAVGIVLGLGMAGIIGATGLGSSTLPPLTLPTTPAPTTATPSPTPTPTPGTEETVAPDPTLTIPDTDVKPGQRFTLEGAFPGLDKGEKLQVQVKDPGQQWDDFPVTATTKANGEYRTQIYTSRTGEREFRMAHTASDKTSPAVKVRIG